MPLWLRVCASGFTLIAALLYIALYFNLTGYQQAFAKAGTELPVFTRVILNIYQSYLSVFVLISVALLVLFFVKSRGAAGRNKFIFALIVFNAIFSAVLFAVSFAGMA